MRWGVGGGGGGGRGQGSQEEEEEGGMRGAVAVMVAGRCGSG